MRHSNNFATKEMMNSEEKVVINVCTVFWQKDSDISWDIFEAFLDVQYFTLDGHLEIVSILSKRISGCFQQKMETVRNDNYRTLNVYSLLLRELVSSFFLRKNIFFLTKYF